MEAYRFENQAKSIWQKHDKEANTSHTFWEKDYLKKVKDFLSKNMIGNTQEMNPAYDFKSKFMLRGSLMN